MSAGNIPLEFGYVVISHGSAVSEVRAVFLELIRALVDKPEAVILKPRTTTDHTVFHLRVAESDIGKILGENASAVSYLLAVAGVKHEQVWVLKIHKATRFNINPGQPLHLKA